MGDHEDVLRIVDSDNEWVVRILPDGNVEINEGITLTEASHQFWDAVQEVIRRQPMEPR